MNNVNSCKPSAAIELTDFLQYHYLSNVSVSPDGKHAAFIKHKCNETLDGYVSDLWVCDLDQGDSHPVTNEGRKQVFCWTPEGSLLHGTPSDHTEFSSTDMCGRSTVGFIVSLKVKSIQPISSTVWLIEATSYVSADAEAQRKDALCVVLEELPAHYNGVGYTSGTRNSLYLFDQKDNSLKQVTPSHFETMGFNWCPDTKKIVCHGHDYTSVRGIRGCIYLYDVVTEHGSVVLQPDIYRLYFASMLGDKVVFVGTRGIHDSNENPVFYILDPVSGQTTELCDPDHYVGGLGIGSDCRYGNGIVSKQHGNSIYFTSAHFESCPLFEVTASGIFRQISHEIGSVDCFDTHGQQAVFIGMRDMGLQELYTMDLVTGQEKRLTSFNLDYTQTHKVCTPKPCYFLNSVGIEITGWVIPPLTMTRAAHILPFWISMVVPRQAMAWCFTMRCNCGQTEVTSCSSAIPEEAMATVMHILPLQASTALLTMMT